MFNPAAIVRADFRRNRAGIVALVVLIAVAVAIGVAVSAQERALRQGSARAADAFDLVIGAPGSETQLVLSTVYLQPASLSLIDGKVLAGLTGREGVAFAAPIGFGDSYQGYPIVGSTAQLVTQDGKLALAEGRLFEGLGEAVVGADVRLAVGSRFVPVHGQVVLEEDAEDEAHHGIEYAVAGRMARLGNPWDRAIVVPIEAVWWIHGLPTGHLANEPLLAAAAEQHAAEEAAESHEEGEAHAAGEAEHAHEEPFAMPAGLAIGPPWDAAVTPGVPAIMVKPTSFTAAYELRSEFRSAATVAVFPAEVLVQLYSVLGDVRDILAWVSILTQVLVICAVMLAVLATLAQRRRLIGVLRALGAPRGYLLTAVWSSVSLLIGAGAMIGLGLGWLGAAALSAYLAGQTAIALPVSLTGQELAMVGVLIAIGIVIAAVPALLVYRQPVSAALRA